MGFNTQLPKDTPPFCSLKDIVFAGPSEALELGLKDGLSGCYPRFVTGADAAIGTAYYLGWDEGIVAYRLITPAAPTAPAP